MDVYLHLDVLRDIYPRYSSPARNR